MGRIHRPLRGHPPRTGVGLLAVLILAALPLLAASTFSFCSTATWASVSALVCCTRETKWVG